MKQSESLTQKTIKRFLQHRMACVSGVILLFFFLVALCAPLIASVLNLNPEAQNIYARYQPLFSTTTLGSGEQEAEIERFIERNPKKINEIAAFLYKAETLGNFDPSDSSEAFFEWMERLQTEMEYKKKSFAMNVPHKAMVEDLLNSFSKFHLFGTDELGRDVLIRLIYGTRVSIGAGLVVAFFAALIGLSIGSVAGYFGGLLDSFLMRITDSLMAIPLLPVLIVLSAIDLQKIGFFSLFVGVDYESVVKMIFILCLFSWMTVARVVRGSILTIREQEYVQAARSIGANNSRIIFLHIIPNVIAPLLVAVTLNIGTAIIIEAALSFLGLGIQPPTPSWGNMLFNAQELIFEAPWLAILPGSLIFVVVVCFNFLGDGLQYAIDPKQ